MRMQRVFLIGVLFLALASGPAMASPDFSLSIDMGALFPADTDAYGAGWEEYAELIGDYGDPLTSFFSPEFNFNLGVVQSFQWPSGFALELEQRLIFTVIEADVANPRDSPELTFFRFQLPLIAHGTYRFMPQGDWTPFVGLGVGGRLVVTAAEGPPFGQQGQVDFAPHVQAKAGVELRPGDFMSVPLYAAYAWSPIPEFQEGDLPTVLYADGDAGGLSLHVGLKLNW